MSDTPSEPHRLSIALPRPLWLGLATLALIVTALVVQIGVPIYRQEAALREIKRVGGHVGTLPGSPQWLRKKVGDERMRLFEKVTEVDLSGTHVTDTELVFLNGLPHIKHLRLNYTDITDTGLSHLRGLYGLQELWLGNPHVTDSGLAHLKGLTNLRKLWLAHTRVTDAGLAHLQSLKKLEELSLYATVVSDHGLAHLKGLTSLQTLDVDFTLVTSAGLAHLYHQTTKDEMKIIEALESPTTLDFVDLPLEDCFAFLKDYHKINIWIDRQDLMDEGVALDQPITLKLADVNLRMVLMLVLEPVQLTYVVEDDALKIVVSSRMANNKLITHTYQVRDLYQESSIVGDQPTEKYGAPSCPPSTLRPGDLETTIKTTIDPESWDEKEGLGLMKYVSESGSLVIRQRPSAHEQILQLLSDLRESKRIERFHARSMSKRGAE